MGNVDAAAEAIEDLLNTEPADVNLDHKSSNTLDNRFKSFYEVMKPEMLTFLYEKWKRCHWRAGSHNPEQPWMQDTKAVKASEEIRGLEWGAMYDAAQRVKALAGVGENLTSGATAASTQIDAAWDGKASDAARQQFTDIGNASRKFKDTSTALSAHVMGVWQTTTKAVDKFCELAGNSAIISFVAKYGTDGLMPNGHSGGLFGTMGDGNRGDWSRIMDHYLTFSSQPEIEAEDPDDWREWTQIFDNFCKDYNDAIHTYREGLYTAHQAVEGALTTFHRAVRDPGSDYDPFVKLKQPEPKEQPKETPTEESGGKVGSGVDTGGGTGGGPTGGGGPTSGGGPTGGGGGTAPADTGGAETPQQPQQGTNPVTGQPLEIDPATGKPYPIDPATGEPIKDAGDDQDTTTTKHGESEITVTEPSKTGEMQVGVDDGKGGTKNYKLDFDPENNPKDGKGGESVGGGAAGGYGPQGVGKDGAAGGKGSPEDEVHTPGEDGKIRIKDGDLEIVAEQPLGPDGATVVTVDDGKGEPTTQILGDKEDVDEYKRMLAQDETRLTGHREELEGRENVSKQEWDELKKEEQSFRERGGQLEADDNKHAEKVGEGKDSAEERSTPKSVFDEAKGDDKSSGIGKSAFDDDSKSGGAGVGGGSSGLSGSSGGGAGGGAAGGGIGGSAQQLDPGARSGVGAPAGGSGAGVGTAPGAEPAGAASGAGSARGGAGAGMMGGGGMMGGMGAGGGGGGDEARSTNAAYQVHGGLFEPEVAEGPFGVARISGSLDEDE